VSLGESQGYCAMVNVEMRWLESGNGVRDSPLAG